MWDRNEQAIWYETTGIYDNDRVPLLDSSVYEGDPVAAFEAYSTAIRVAVSNLVRGLEAAPLGLKRSGANQDRRWDHRFITASSSRPRVTPASTFR